MPCSEDGQTDLALCIDIRVESTSATICGLCIDFGRLAGVVGTEADREFEEAVLVGGLRRTDDQSLDLSDIGFLTRNRDG
jgi:hypothetical protein